MSGFVRGAVMTIVVLGLAWGGAIAYWRATGAAPGAVEMIVLLAVVPLLVLAAIWAVRALLRRRRAAAAAAPAATSAASGGDAVAGTQADAAPMLRPLAVLGSAVRLPLGLDPGALLADPLSSARLRPHPRHRDHHGLPVYLAMADDIDATVPLPQEFDGEQAEYIRRALAMLEPVAEDLLLQAAQVLPLLEQVEGRVVAGWRQQVDQVVERQLSIELLVPSDWAMPAREACQAWLQRSAQQFGIDARRFIVQVLPADGGDEVWSRLRRRLDASTQTTPGWQLLLACQSAVAQSSLERWEASGWLRSQSNPEGRVPGEAAAGVLLGWPATGPEAVLRSVERVELPERGSAAARARVTGKLATSMLEASAIDAARIDLVLSDADLRAAPAAEASGAASQACGELDLSRQYLALCSSTGEIGAVQPLAQLALARQHLDAGGEAALMLAVTPATTRWVAVLDSQSPEQTDAGDASAADAAQPETA